MHQGSASTPPDLPPFNRFVKVLWFVLLVSIGMYWLIPSFLDLPPERSLDPLVQRVLAAMAAATAIGILFLRFNLISRAVSDIAPGADFALLIARLRTLYILCFVLAESVALYGLVVYFLGATREQASWFFLGGFALLGLCYPKSIERPPGV